MDEIVLQAYAKINPALDVLYRRPDGYHEVRMVMQSLALHDTIVLKKLTDPEILIKSNLRYLPTDENNLVYQAIALIRSKYHITGGVFARLIKRIPVAAGLAGGSSDCAAALIGMNRLFHLQLTTKALCELGSTLGADVPFCLTGGTVLSEGIGERLTGLCAAPSCHVVLVKPPYRVSTRYVYEHLVLEETPHPDIDRMLAALSSGEYTSFASALGNILESVTIALHPDIAQIKSQLIGFGAQGALMSGSGPTVFGLFADRHQAQRAYEYFQSDSGKHRVWLTRFHSV